MAQMQPHYLQSHGHPSAPASYPYDSRTHAYASPSGMSYPAPTGYYPTNVHGSSPSSHEQHRAVTSSPSISYAKDGRPARHHEMNPPTSAGQQYGPGDWRPEPRASSYSPQPFAPGPQYLTPMHGHSAPVSPYARERPDVLGGMSRSWTIGMPPAGSHTAQAPLSSGPFLTPDLYTPPRLSVPTGHELSWLQHDSSGRTAQPRPRSEGRDKNRRPHGPPPKAVLGGVGGKTWDELQLANRSVSAPLPNKTVSNERRGDASPNGMGRNGAVAKDEESNGPSFKGNPIIFRPPFPTYSPPDSPEVSKEGRPDDNPEAQETTPPPKVARKDAFPWPIRRPRGPPETIPLPLSPSDTTMKGRRRRIRTGASRELMHDGQGNKGGARKEVAVSVPDPHALDRLRAEADERKRLSATTASEGSTSGEGKKEADQTLTGFDPSETIGRRPSLLSDRMPAHSRAQSYSQTTQSSRGEGISVASPPSSQRRRLRLSDSGFVRKQLRGMMKERTRSLDDMPVSPKRAKEGEEGPEPRTKESGELEATATEDEGPSVLTETKLPVPTDVQAYTTMVSALDKAQGPEACHQGLKKSEITQMPDTGQRGIKKDVNEKDVTFDHVPGQLPEYVVAESEPTRKRKVKLGALDGYLGRQLNVSGLLGPVKRDRRKPDSEVPSERKGQASEQAGKEKGEDVALSLANTPPTAADTIRKRMRADSDDRPTGKIESRPPVSVAPLSRLRASASAFQPSPGAAFRSVPGNQKTFGFSTPGQSTSVVEEVRAVGSLRPGAAVFLPRLPSIPVSEPLPTFECSQASSPGLSAGSSVKATSIAGHVPESEPGQQQEDVKDEKEVVVDTDSQDTPSPHSPAAEMHGIFAVSPTASVADDELFYRAPESEVSETAHDEMESFDPISYSYDPIADGVFDASEFHTSTPRRDHSHLPSGSTEDFASSPKQLPPRSPLVTVSGPLTNGDDKQKFRDWVFPLADHDHRPSISRRHTFDNPHDGEPGPEGRQGVASTFASRVGDLRAFLASNIKGDHLRVSSATDHLASNRSSVEFPIRSPTKRLAVVNSTMSGPSTPVPDAEEVDEHQARLHALRMAVLGIQDKVDRLPPTREQVEKVSQENIAEQMTQVLNRLNALQAPQQTDLSALSTTLEQQSALLSSLTSLLQVQNGHKADHLVPLLEGHQAILDRFATLNEKNDMLADELERVSSAVVSRENLDPPPREEDLRAIETLRQELHDLQLVGQRDRLEAQQAQRDLTSGNKRIEELQDEVRSAKSQADLAAIATAEMGVECRRLQDDNARLQAEAEEARRRVQEEMQRRESSAGESQMQASEVAQLRKLTTGLHETMLVKLAAMEQSRNNFQADSLLTDHQEKSARLEQELKSTREQLRDEHEKNTSARSDQHTHEAEVATLRLQLDHERQQRTGWHERARVLEEYLMQERTYRTEAEATARERTYVAQLQEARIAGLIEDNHYWRSFAMSYDRKAYREYIKSDPFKGIESRTDGHESGREGSKSDPNGAGVVTTSSSVTKAGISGLETNEDPWGR